MHACVVTLLNKLHTVTNNDAKLYLHFVVTASANFSSITYVSKVHVHS